MGNEASIGVDYTVNKESFGTAAEWVLYEGRRNAPKTIEQNTEDGAAEVLDNISGNVVTVFVGMPGEKRGKTSTLHNNVKVLVYVHIQSCFAVLLVYNMPIACWYHLCAFH